MIDYVFFHQQPLDLFVKFLCEQGLEPETRVFEDRMEVQVPDDLDEDLSDRIDDRYDRLIDMEGELTDAEQYDTAESYQMAGITINLKNGKTVYADVDPGLLSRLLESVTAEEFATVVDAIASAVEEEEQRTYCQRVRDGDT